MIRIEQLVFRHRKRTEPVIDGLSFSVRKGAFAALLGPNGSGKTTLFKCLAGLWRPEAGRILLDGQSAGGLSWRQRATLMAMVPQEHVPPFAYSVYEAVLMGRAPHLSAYATPSGKDEQATCDALQSVGIAHLAGRSYTRISGGERQLVLIARALAQQAPVLLLDEPTSHLDFRNQHLVLETVRRVAAEKELTVLMTLHDPNMAAFFADQILMLHHGAILADGSPETVMTAPNLTRLYSIGIGIVGDDERTMIYPKSR